MGLYFVLKLLQTGTVPMWSSHVCCQCRVRCMSRVVGYRRVVQKTQVPAPGTLGCTLDSMLKQRVWRFRGTGVKSMYLSAVYFERKGS